MISCRPIANLVKLLVSNKWWAVTYIVLSKKIHKRKQDYKKIENLNQKMEEEEKVPHGKCQINIMNVKLSIKWVCHPTPYTIRFSSPKTLTDRPPGHLVQW